MPRMCLNVERSQISNMSIIKVRKVKKIYVFTFFRHLIMSNQIKNPSSTLVGYLER